MTARMKANCIAACVGCLAACFVGLVVPAPQAHAQSCEAAQDDAGSCDDDAGALPSGTGDAGGDGNEASCSCTNDLESGDQGQIHLCTGATSASACEAMKCERGKARAVACPVSQADLCCRIESRDTYVQLYEDCDHPNCTAGFLAQCEDLGGDVLEGSCKSPSGPYEGYDSYSNDESDCSVANVGAKRERDLGLSGGLVSALSGLALWRRRRRVSA